MKNESSIKKLLVIFVLVTIGIFVIYKYLNIKKTQKKPYTPKFPSSVKEKEEESEWFERDVTNMQLARDDRACDPVVYQSALGEVFDVFLAEMEKEDHTQYWYRVRGKVKDIYKDKNGQTYLLLENSPDPLSVKVTKPDISEYIPTSDFDTLDLVKLGDEVGIGLVSGCTENEQLWLKTYTFNTY